MYATRNLGPERRAQGEQAAKGPESCLQTLSRREAQTNRWSSGPRPRRRPHPRPQLLFPGTVCRAAHPSVSRRSLRSVFLSQCLGSPPCLSPLSLRLSLTHTHTHPQPSFTSAALPGAGAGRDPQRGAQLSASWWATPAPKHRAGDTEEGGTARGQGASLGAGVVLQQIRGPGTCQAERLVGAKAWSGAGGAVGGQAWPLPQAMWGGAGREGA